MDTMAKLVKYINTVSAPPMVLPFHQVIQLDVASISLIVMHFSQRMAYHLAMPLKILILLNYFTLVLDLAPVENKCLPTLDKNLFYLILSSMSR